MRACARARHCELRAMIRIVEGSTEYRLTHIAATTRVNPKNTGSPPQPKRGGMWSGCVYDCKHFLWGGSGTCSSSSGDVGSPVCSCDAGYRSRDANGNPSCVPTWVLVAAYLLLAITSVLVAALTVWNIAQHRQLPVRYRRLRKTGIRMRALVFASVYILGFGSIGVALAARAGKTAYADPGVLQVNYMFLTPSLLFGVAMMAEYWVECLPSQLCSPESLAGRLQTASENSNLFAWAGLANAAPVAAFGALMTSFQDWPQMVVDLALVAGTIAAVGVILYVAVRTSTVIDQAMSQGSATSVAFYSKARKSVWQQALTLITVGVVMIAVTTAKQLTRAGRSTPIIVWTLQILCGHAVTVVFAAATRVQEPPPSAARKASCTTAFEAGPQAVGCCSVFAAAAAAVYALLHKQKARLPNGRGMGQALPEYKADGDDSKWNGTVVVDNNNNHNNNSREYLREEDHATSSVMVATKSAWSSGRRAWGCRSSNGDAAKVLPIDTTAAASADDDDNLSVPRSFSVNVDHEDATARRSLPDRVEEWTLTSSNTRGWSYSLQE